MKVNDSRFIELDFSGDFYFKERIIHYFIHPKGGVSAVTLSLN